jgi:hypothetical protein
MEAHKWTNLSVFGQVEDDPVQHALEVLGQQLVCFVQHQNIAVVHIRHLQAADKLITLIPPKQLPVTSRPNNVYFTHKHKTVAEVGLKPRFFL